MTGINPSPIIRVMENLLKISKYLSKLSASDMASMTFKSTQKSQSAKTKPPKAIKPKKTDYSTEVSLQTTTNPVDSIPPGGINAY